jgi:hypothetical protein
MGLPGDSAPRAKDISDVKNSYFPVEVSIVYKKISDTR